MSSVQFLRYFLIFLAFSLSLASYDACSAESAMTWQVSPAYESTSNVNDSKLVVKDDSNTERTIYDGSFAVLIIEKNYKNGWSSPVLEGSRSEKMLIETLEKRGFHVLAWENLTGKQLLATLDDVLFNIGYRDDNRLFFYGSICIPGS
jgi:hypothetical protein